MDFEDQTRKDRFSFWPWKRSAEKPAGCREKDPGFKRSDLSDFVWLVYSIFFFIEPVTRHSTPYWIQFAIFYAIFLALYAGLILAPKRWQHYPLLLGMWVLGVVYYPQNSGSWGVFVYIAAMVPFIAESLLISALTFVLACGTLIAESLLLHHGPWNWAFGSLMILCVGGINLLMAQKVRANKKLQMANEEIEQLAKLAERERIARDLHDVLGHTLSVIVLKSELAGRLFERDPRRAAAEIADVENISRTALSEVREAIRGYRAEGLVAEIKRARSTLDAAGVTLICEEKVPVLNPTEETVVSLVVREAVTNVVRHAQASRCVMRFIAEDGRRVLLVEDDGRGGVREEGNGLRGMRERVESLGGRFAVDGSRGTRLMIELPIAGVPL
jgi:two-component system, NarL family, sensor histidine kinase DesK